MATHTIHTRASRAAVREAVLSIPQEALSGGPASSALLTRVGMVVLGRVRAAFIVKARGGTDEAGDRWAPLKPATIARRRGARKGSGPPPSDNAADRRARGIIDGNAKPFDKYAGSQVEILRDTGLLLNSLSPGIASPDKVFRVAPGVVTIGTTRQGAAAHHTGVPGKLPQRRLWPKVGKWPASWWQDILEQARDGVVDIAVEQIREAT